MQKMQMINSIQVANRTELLARVKELLLSADVAAGVKYVFVPQGAYVTLVQQALVGSAAEMGSRVVTFDEWTQDRWDLFGDGRVLVTPLLRQLLLTEIVERQFENVATAGMVSLLEKLIDQAYVELLDRTQEPGACDLLTDEQQEIMTCLRIYKDTLAEKGLCEVNEARACLVRICPMPDLVLCVGCRQLSFADRTFLEALAKSTLVYELSDGCSHVCGCPERNPELTALLNCLFKAHDEPLRPQGVIQFMLPMGAYAAPVLMVRTIYDRVQQARTRQEGASVHKSALPPVCVSMKNPQALYNNIASVLLDVGITARLHDVVTFADTALGQALSALVELFYGKDASGVCVPTDFLLGSFSGVSFERAYKLNAKWRSDRTLTLQVVCEDLKAASPLAERFISCFEQGNLLELFALISEHLQQDTHHDEGWVVLQQKALSAAQEFVEACCLLDRRPESCWQVLAGKSISYTVQTTLPERDALDTPDVVFMPLERVAQSADCSYASLIVGELSAAQYPVRVREDSADTLLELFGMRQTQDALTDAREVFFQALSSARDTLSFERVLFDEASDEAYPAVMFEEVVDCYRSADAFDESINKQTGLPQILDSVTVTQPEEEVYQQAELFVVDETNACAPRPLQPSLSWPEHAKEKPSLVTKDLVVLPREHIVRPDGQTCALPRLSASALESYLECPYKWFTSRRLGLDTLDADFGPQEMGSFAHALFKDFYEVFQTQGHARVTSANIEDAKAQFLKLFDERLEAEYEKDPNEKPLIACTELERIELGDLRKRLLNALERQAYLLPRYTPTYFEHPFGLKGAPYFEYAGCLLSGSIDRIDVNEHGQAVVIDYKSSVGTLYQVGTCSEAWQAQGLVLPSKIQSLVYAQVARKTLGLDVVGALYLSLGNVKSDADSLAGAFDHVALGSQELLGLSSKKAAIPGEASTEYGVKSFTELLDHTEAAIACAVQSMLQGDILPHLREKHEKVCTYCPVLSCELRD